MHIEVEVNLLHTKLQTYDIFRLKMIKKRQKWKFRGLFFSATFIQCLSSNVCKIKAQCNTHRQIHT